MSAHHRYWVVTSSVLVFLCFAFFAARPALRSPHAFPSSTTKIDDFQAPKRNIWADLADEEVENLLNYLYTKPSDLNLTRAENATAWDNHIAFVEVLPPNKTDAVQYLESTAQTPPRWARVSVNQGVTEEAGIYQYMVGPLPATNKTEILPLTFCYNSGRNYVRNPLPNYEDLLEWFADLSEEISDIVDNLLGKVTNPGHIPNAPPLIAIARPAAYDGYKVSGWASIHGPGLRLDAWSLLPQGLYCKFEITGRDSSKWKVHEWYYNGILYNSTEAFRAAWKAPGFVKTPPNLDGAWTAAEPETRGLPDRNKPPPLSIQPWGARFKTDLKEKFVSWMGFEFYITTLQATAVEPLGYQLGLQEAMAHYAGNDPTTIGMLWFDTMFGMGFNMYELVPGYDCPAYATYLPVTFHRGDKSITRNNSICIFEYTADHPLQRHTSPTHLTISRNTYLVVRSVSTVGNYDYMIDYIFYLDGTIEVKVRASGYVFGAYHIAPGSSVQDNRKRDMPIYEYGYQVHDTIVTSMHDHALNFKADLDVVGSSNTMYRVDIAPYHHRYPWDDTPRNTMHLRHNPIETETGLNWPANAGAMYVVVNNDTTNKWGEKRGYRITPGTGMGIPPHLTMKNSTALGRSAGWSDMDLWILRQKDTERKSASEYNGLEPEDPLIDFAKMVDGEDIVQEDLVVYFNLGTHHIPHSGDIPNTLMHTSASSVMFVPHNFHDWDPSRESAQGVKLEMRKPGNGSKVKYYGAKYSKPVELDARDLEPNLSDYSAPEDSPMDLSWNATLASL